MLPIADLKAAVLAPCTRAELVPPARFAAKTFAGYDIDPTVPGQDLAVARVQAFATWSRPRLAFWKRGSERPGLYLDGGFGVGKTHLLAASFHAARGTRTYLSFAEAMSLVILLGSATKAADLIASELVCLDEFELDDPTNTRLIDLLLEELVARDSRIITTSNTVPGELGHGRMSVDQFRNQLARIADRFTDVHVPGGDHRRLRLRDGADPPGWSGNRRAVAVSPFACTAEELDGLLSGVPIANLRRLATRLPQLTITNVSAFTDQFRALRFAVFIDRMYDAGSVLAISADVPLDGLFPPEHCSEAFGKKYRRCLSRLSEMCV